MIRKWRYLFRRERYHKVWSYEELNQHELKRKIKEGWTELKM